MIIMDLNVNTGNSMVRKNQGVSLDWDGPIMRVAISVKLYGRKISVNHDIRHRYYDNMGKKSDFNIFFKTHYTVNNQLTVFADLQVEKCRLYRKWN